MSLMKAMVLEKPSAVETQPLQPREIPIPAPQENEVVIAVRACGVCHTDLHVVEGELPPHKSPVVPGHQVVGVVASVGRNAKFFREGDRVGIPWLNGACASIRSKSVCAFCEQGKENLCEEAEFTGYDVDGGFAEFARVDERFAHTLPKNFSDLEVAPLLCAGVIGFRALRLSEIQKGARLGLFGFGASAHLVIQVARHWGCEVDVFTRSPEHRLLARQLGARRTVSAQEAQAGSLDSAIIFAPAGSLVPLALQALKRGGTLVLAGIFMTPVPEMNYTLLYEERTIRSAANSTRADVRDFLEVAAAIRLHTEVEPFSLHQANEALRKLKHSQLRAAAVLKIANS